MFTIVCLLFDAIVVVVILFYLFIYLFASLFPENSF